MKNFLLLLLITSCLAACTGKYKTTYTYEPPVTERGLQCVTQCKQAKTMCQKLCGKDSAECRARAMEVAESHYAVYVEKQQEMNKPIKKTVNSFFNDSQCKAASCGCEVDYRSCYQMCGGHLISQRVCVANCRR